MKIKKIFTSLGFAAGALALHDPAEGDTGSIVDTDVDVFPARPFTAGMAAFTPGGA